MKIILVFILFTLSFNLYSSYPEFFGSSPTNSAIANQATSSATDAGNNYYIPAISAFSKRTSFSVSAANVSTKFEPITQIITKNTSNGVSTEVGSAQTEYDDFKVTGIHLTLPIANKNLGSLSFSIFTPLGKFAETNSGDSFLPEYVMYRSRYRRTMIYFNYAHRISKRWALSIGGNISYQAGSNVYTQTSLNGTSYGSSASLKSEIKPTLSGVFSLIRKTNESLAYFSFLQEVKTNFEVDSEGEINQPTPGLFTIGINTMAYYDPYIFRLGLNKKFGSLEFFNSIEYQIWEGYKTPVVRIEDKGGIINASNDYESVQTRNILIPKTALRYLLTDKFGMALGLSYRQTPLKGDFSNSGNSVDTSSTIITFGGDYSVRIFDTPFTLAANTQYHKLKERNIVKAPNQENGSTGSKIGAPGYKLGGSVLSIGLGLSGSF